MCRVIRTAERSVGCWTTTPRHPYQQVATLRGACKQGTSQGTSQGTGQDRDPVHDPSVRCERVEGACSRARSIGAPRGLDPEAVLLPTRRPCRLQLTRGGQPASGARVGWRVVCVVVVRPESEPGSCVLRVGRINSSFSSRPLDLPPAPRNGTVFLPFPSLILLFASNRRSFATPTLIPATPGYFSLFNSPAFARHSLAEARLVDHQNKPPTHPRNPSSACRL